MNTPASNQISAVVPPVRAAADHVPARFAARVACAPEAIAIAMADREIDYASLDVASRAIAAELGALGVDRSGLVAVCLPRSIELVAAVLAIWRAGAAFLALDPAWPDNRLRAIIADADCAALLCDSPASRRELAPVGMPVMVVAADRPGEGAGDLAVDAAALAYVIYTSGSTGQPKGIEIGHDNLASLVAWHQAAFDLGPDDRVAHVAGLGFDASVWEIWPALCAGATLLPAPDDARMSAETLRDWLVSARVTVAFVPTVLAERMVALDWPTRTALRLMLTGGDRLHVYPRRGLPFSLVNNYGPSECTVVATSGMVAALADPQGLPSIGWPIAGTQIHLLDPTGEPVADGVQGEMYVAGASVGRGYRGQPALTADRFLRDPFDPASKRMMFRTGDLGVRQPNGAIAFAGRLDDQVQVRGVRVEPAEIAAVLTRHPGISAATVVQVEGDLIAYLVPGEQPAPTAPAVRAFLADHLPAAMIPTAFALIDQLPMTANGKLDRAALPDLAAARQLAEEAVVAPASPVEERLVEIMSSVMPGRVIGIDDNFFMIGGHSLLGAQLVLKASEAFGVELTLRVLFEAPTIRALALWIEARIFEMVAAMSDEDAYSRAAE